MVHRQGQAKVIAPLINWRRPRNIPIILEALRAQSVTVHVSLVECAPGTEWELPASVAARFDSVFTIRDNIGPCSRFVPPLMLPGFDHVWFTTDDYAPGPKALEWFLRSADFAKYRFATIGQDGRRVNSDNQLGGMRVKMTNSYLPPVDVVTTYELMLTANLPAAIEFRNELDARFGDQVSLTEDDLILCLGVQRATGLPSVLTLAPPTDAESWRQRQLPAPNALCSRPDHRERRDRFVRQAMEIGWKQCY
jgi:hypothetical protein